MAKHLFILGNGFDINLGLKTSYKDFIRSGFFEDLIPENTFAVHLKEKLELEKWVDVELELEEFVQKNFPSVSNMQIYYKEVKNALAGYLNYINATSNRRETKSVAYKIFKEAFSYGYEPSVLNFNYTEAAESIYQDCTGRNYKSLEDKDKFIYIHGNLLDNNIILGLHDKAQIDRNSFLRKSSSDNFHTKNISEYLEKFEVITFFGHSLGKTDHDYFSGFLNKCAAGVILNKNITIYGKGELGINDIKHQLHEMTGGVGSLKNKGNTLRVIDVDTINI